ncbi:MAG TPA: PDZ domain-containing protein [Thermoanaerobaculia bacterium]
MRTFIAALLVALAPAAYALFQSPAVSRTHVAFIHGGQVWVVPRGGGAATQVTRTPGPKLDVRFSPDGQRLAYTANETRGFVNIFTIPLKGGEPSRVTWLPSHQVLTQWTADDRLLFHTDALSFSSIEMQLYTVPSRGGLPERLPLRYGADGALDASGRRLAYRPQWPNPLIAHWKRYRGGAAPDISVVDLAGGGSTKITDWNGPDLRPMWRGDVLYYVSDAGTEQRANLWSYDTRTRARKQLTRFADYDVRDASIGGDAIVFQHGPELQLLDLRSGRSSAMRIDVPRAELQRDVDASNFITNRQVANGRVLYEARGDLWLSERGATPRNLTNTSGAFEREAALSPDGARVAYMSDAGGEYQLYVREVSSPNAVALTHAASGFRFRPVWSRDGKRLAFVDQRGAIFVCDVESRSVSEADRDPWAEPVELAWSSDSSWLAYTKTAANRLTTIWRYDVVTQSKQQLTAAQFNASTPVFDPRGEHLFFISYRNFSMPLADWLSQRFVHRAMATLMAVPLDSAFDTAFDTAAFERRAFRLGTTPGSLLALGATSDGNPVYALSDLAGARSVRVYRMREKKEEVLLPGTSDFTMSQDGAELLTGNTLRTLATNAETKLDTTMPLHVDLRAEWRQLFADVVRNQRDFYFAPKTGSHDWDAIARAYRPLLEQCVTRQEVNDVLAEMIGESSTGHAYMAARGDVPQPPPGNVGLLGADYELANGVFRIARIYQGAPWDDTLRSPLTSAGVREGEPLLAVNGKALDVTRDPRAAFEGLAGKSVTLTVGSPPREVTVTPLDDENGLRERDWVERNRAFASERSNDRIGYIHVSDFSTNGLNQFAQQFYGQIDKEALIVDARWSQGGFTGAHLAELLGRHALNFTAVRESPNAWPAPRWGAHFGAKALLVSHMTVSAGENFSLYFRKLALGPIIGARTWGGLTGLNPVPALIDGGYANVPNAPFFDESGWLVEGHGVEPDIAVEDDPARANDAQLERAIEEMLKTLK